mgnify:FL=1
MNGLKMSRRKLTNLIVIDSTETKPNSDITIRDVDEWHRIAGRLKVGYHFFIRRDGLIEVGRNLNEVGAHTKEHNADSVSVCLAGGLNTRGVVAPDYGKPQIESLFTLVLTLTYMYPNATVVGHRDLSKTENPSFNVKEWWKANSENCGLLKHKLRG